MSDMDDSTTKLQTKAERVIGAGTDTKAPVALKGNNTRGKDSDVSTKFEPNLIVISRNR